MEHRMNLRPDPFEAMKSGQKNVELRLNDEKRKKIQVGDSICFIQTETGEALRVKVTGRREFADFARLYEAYEPLRMGYRPGEIADPRDMEAYYPAQEQGRWGVVAIEIERI